MYVEKCRPISVCDIVEVNVVAEPAPDRVSETTLVIRPKRTSPMMLGRTQ